MDVKQGFANFCVHRMRAADFVMDADGVGTVKKSRRGVKRGQTAATN